MDVSMSEIAKRKSIEVFCCYARKDQPLLLELKAHLASLERRGDITLWADIDIDAGMEWEKEIHRHLNTARIILLLVSPDFMVSEYCYSKEMKRAMERHKVGEACVIPVILRPTLWENAPFGSLQALPENAEPVTGSSWHTQDRAFLSIARSLKQIVLELAVKTQIHVSSLKPFSHHEQRSMTVTRLGEIYTRSGLHNPYYHLKPICDAQMFFGRLQEMDRIYSQLENRQCVAICGSQRIGKSSLLQQLCLAESRRQLGYENTFQRYIFVLIDLGEFATQSLDELFEMISAKVMTQWNRQIEHNNWISADDFQERGMIGFSELLVTIRRWGFYLVLLLDEFDIVHYNSLYDADFFSFLRALASRVSYVTASTRPLREVTHVDVIAGGSPFFNIFSSVTLGPLTTVAATQLINVPSGRLGFPFTSEEVEWITELAGRHPFFIQRMCYYLYEEKLTKSNTDINKDKIEKQVYLDLNPHFEIILRDVNKEEKDKLRYIIQKSLEIDHFLELSESKLFKNFFIEKDIEYYLFQINVEHIKEALDNIDDNRSLGNNILSKTCYIQKKTQEYGLSVSELGLLVRGFLEEGFTRLQPGKVRSDAAPQWRLYNILYYRYFKHHLTNSHIATRLGIGSMSQFYRDKNRALQTLLKEILELEKNALSK